MTVDIDKTPLRFGKHKALTPEQVYEIDPGYLIWLWDTVANADKLLTIELLEAACQQWEPGWEDRESGDLWDRLGGYW